jgi:hypothetical protein
VNGEFDRLHASTGRPSIPPERLLRGSILIELYSVRCVDILVADALIKETAAVRQMPGRQRSKQAGPSAYRWSRQGQMQNKYTACNASRKG